MMNLERIFVIITIVTRTAYAQLGVEAARTICPALRKLYQPYKRIDNLQGALNRRSDMLWKVTKMPHYYDHFDENNNFCSLYHYGPDCRASQSVKMPISDESSFSMFTYNAKTDNTLRIQYETENIVPDYLIFSRKITKMEVIDTKMGHAVIENVDQIPRILMSAFSELYTYVAIEPHGYWYIMQTCDESVTWVRLPVPFVPYNEDSGVLKVLSNLEAIEREVDEKLTLLGINMSTVTKVPLASPFPLRPETTPQFRRVPPTLPYPPQPMTSPFPPRTDASSSLPQRRPLPIPTVSPFTSHSENPFASEPVTSNIPPRSGNPFDYQTVTSPFPPQQTTPSSPPQSTVPSFLPRPTTETFYPPPMTSPSPQPVTSSSPPQPTASSPPSQPETSSSSPQTKTSTSPSQDFPDLIKFD